MNYYQVLGRCRHLLGEGKAAGYRQSNDMRYAYVGFASDLRGPVLARRKPNTEGSLKRKATVSFGLEEDSGDSCNAEASSSVQQDQAVEFIALPTGANIGQEFMLHHSMLIPANFEAMKKHVTYQTLQTTTAERFAFNNQIRETLALLNCGYAPNGSEFVATCTEDATPQLYGPGKTVKPKQHSYTSVLLEGTTRPSGFVLKLALIDAMEFPKALIDMVRKFLKQLKMDFIPIRQALTAIILWADIITCESSFKTDGKRGDPLPKVGLAVFIVYLGHMFKWVEWMGLAEYPHPFRFCARAAETDLTHAAITIDSEGLDENQVFMLLKKVTSRVEKIQVCERVEVWPWMMPGSRLPKVYGPGVPKSPEDTPMALTGLMHIRYYGLEDYIPSTPTYVPRGSRTIRDRLGLGSKLVTVTYPDWVGQDSPIKAIGPVTIEKAVLANHATLLPYWKLSAALSLPDPAKEQQSVSQPDYEKYEDMMLHWVTFMAANPTPVMHVSWKNGLEEAKQLSVEKRSVDLLRGLVLSAIEETETDLILLRAKVHGVTTLNPFQEDDVFLIIPLIMGRLMGFEHTLYNDDANDDDKEHNDDDDNETETETEDEEEEEEGEDDKKPYRLWKDYFIPLAKRETFRKSISLYGTYLSRQIRAADMSNPGSISEMKWKADCCINIIEAEVLTSRYVEWVQQWEEKFPEVAKRK